MESEFSAACASSPRQLNSHLNEEDEMEGLKRSLTRMQASTAFNTKQEEASLGDSKASNSEYIEQLERLRSEDNHRIK